MQAAATDGIDANQLEALYTDAVRDTIARLEETGSPVITDGEQRKPSFVTYPIDGLEGLAPDGVTIPFEDGHTRQLPRLTHAEAHSDSVQLLAGWPSRRRGHGVLEVLLRPAREP